MSAKTVTDHASTHKTEKTCNGFVGLKSVTKRLGKCEEGSRKLDHTYVVKNVGLNHSCDHSGYIRAKLRIDHCEGRSVSILVIFKCGVCCLDGVYISGHSRCRAVIYHLIESCAVSSNRGICSSAKNLRDVLSQSDRAKGVSCTVFVEYVYEITTVCIINSVERQSKCRNLSGQALKQCDCTACNSLLNSVSVHGNHFVNDSVRCRAGNILRTVNTVFGILVDDVKDVLRCYINFNIDTEHALDGFLERCFNNTCYVFTSSQILVCDTCLKVSTERAENSAEQRSVQASKSKNSVKRYRCVLGADDSVLNSEIYADGNSLRGIKNSVCKLLVIRHSFILHNFPKGNRNKAIAGELYALKKAPNGTASAANDRLYESVTDDGIGVRSAVFFVEIITVNVNHTVNKACICIVESCVCIALVAAKLL